jgi:hypothetical protein
MNTFVHTGKIDVDQAFDSPVAGLACARESAVNAEQQTPKGFIRVGAAAQTLIARLQQAFPSFDGTTPSHILSARTNAENAPSIDGAIATP